MGWTAHRTPRNTLHVINTDNGSHFEAVDEDEAQATIDAIAQSEEEKQRAAEEADRNANELTTAVGGPPTLRSN